MRAAYRTVWSTGQTPLRVSDSAYDDSASRIINGVARGQVRFEDIAACPSICRFRGKGVRTFFARGIPPTWPLTGGTASVCLLVGGPTCAGSLRRSIHRIAGGQTTFQNIAAGVLVVFWILPRSRAFIFARVFCYGLANI